MHGITAADADLRRWAEASSDAERRLLGGPGMAEIKGALEGMSLAELESAAEGDVPEAVRALPQFSRLNRGLGLAEYRTSALAKMLLEERRADLECWLESHFPDLGREYCEEAAA